MIIGVTSGKCEESESHLSKINGLISFLSSSVHLL
jgi:hypothetical protein